MSIESTHNALAARRQSMTVADALALAAEGQADAFEVLFRAYSGRIRVFAEVRGNGDPDAIASDVMLKVFRNLDSFSGDEDAFTRWVFTIARNELIDAHRKRSRRPDLTNAAIPESPTRSTEEVVVEHIASDEFVLQLNCLTSEQREVVALRILDDLSLADVAAIVGKSVTAVKGLQRRGLESLQLALRDGATI